MEVEKLTDKEIEVLATEAIREMNQRKNKDWIISFGRKVEKKVLIINQIEVKE